MCTEKSLEGCLQDTYPRMPWCQRFCLLFYRGNIWQRVNSSQLLPTMSRGVLTQLPFIFLYAGTNKSVRNPHKSLSLCKGGHSHFSIIVSILQMRKQTAKSNRLCPRRPVSGEPGHKGESLRWIMRPHQVSQYFSCLCFLQLGKRCGTRGPA